MYFTQKRKETHCTSLLYIPKKIRYFGTSPVLYCAFPRVDPRKSELWVGICLLWEVRIVKMRATNYQNSRVQQKEEGTNLLRRKYSRSILKTTGVERTNTSYDRTISQHWSIWIWTDNQPNHLQQIVFLLHTAYFLFRLKFLAQCIMH